MSTMKVGIVLPNIGPQATGENIVRLATQAEKAGFDSLWTVTRILWPLNPQTPYIASSNGSLPNEYQTVLDPLDVLMYVAANTNKISLGTTVIVVLYTSNARAPYFIYLSLLPKAKKSF